MAITAYTGPPGAGKSYALISQVILPAIISGRRVLTNVAGCVPDRFQSAALLKGAEAPGELVLFEGPDALLPGFFPTPERPSGCFVRPGDLLVFDEWRLTFANRGAVGNPALEPFLRWHRHLVGEDGLALDVVIGTQLITDIHRDFRGLVERSYKFRKLSAVGTPKFYVYDIYEGSDQRKGTSFRTGNGKFSKEIFDLYKSFDTDGEASETRTDGRATLFSKPFIALGVVALLLMLYGGWRAYSVFFGGPDDADGKLGARGDLPPPPAGSAAIPIAQQPSSSAWRIVGHIESNSATMVVVADGKGGMRVVHGRDFVFENGRPISGFVDGSKVNAEDRLAIESGNSLLPAQSGYRPPAGLGGY